MKIPTPAHGARYLSTNISMTFCAATPGPHFCITPLADFGKKIHWITDLHYRVSSTGLDNIATYPDGVARPWAGHPDTHAHAKAPAAELFRKLEPLVTPELSEKLKMVDGFDQKILREISGDEQEDLKWGAAMGISVEKLRRMGLVAGFGKVAITDLGRRALIHLT